MLKNFRNIILVSIFILGAACSCPCLAWQDGGYYGDWNYHGSGRDHAYSAYIDRANYIGPADYKYIDGPLVIMNPSATISAPPQEIPVNIPNGHGGYMTIMIRRDGDGFLGPKGEYYPEFPKVFQLQMKYGQ